MRGSGSISQSVFIFQRSVGKLPTGDWMFWIAKKAGVDLKTLTKAKALCALTVRHLMKDQRSITACEVAMKFSNGDATMEEMAAAAAAAAADAAYAAAYAAYAAARKENQKKTADICREVLTIEIMKLISNE